MAYLLTSTPGGQFGERHLLTDFSNLTWQHPLVANYGNLAKTQPLAVDLSIAPWWLISATLHRNALGGTLWQLGQGAPLVADFSNLTLEHTG